MSKRFGLAVVLLAVATLVASESNSLAGHHRQRRGCGSCGSACAAPAACGSCGSGCEVASAAPAEAPAPLASTAPKQAEPAAVVEAAAPAKATYTQTTARRRGLFRRG